MKNPILSNPDIGFGKNINVIDAKANTNDPATINVTLLAHDSLMFCVFVSFSLIASTYVIGIEVIGIGIDVEFSNLNDLPSILDGHVMKNIRPRANAMIINVWHIARIFCLGVYDFLYQLIISIFLFVNIL